MACTSGLPVLCGYILVHVLTGFKRDCVVHRGITYAGDKAETGDGKACSRWDTVHTSSSDIDLHDVQVRFILSSLFLVLSFYLTCNCNTAKQLFLRPCSVIYMCCYCLLSVH